jgi:hypothetical protein
VMGPEEPFNRPDVTAHAESIPARAGNGHSCELARRAAVRPAFDSSRYGAAVTRCRR